MRLISVIFTVATLLTATNSAAATQRNMSNARLETAVDYALMESHAVEAHKIDINAQEGIITLTGSVNDLISYDKAVEVAEAVKGVRSVVNELEVQPAVRPDAELRQDIAAALRADPTADAYDVDISVSNGQVTLKGEVGSWQERRLVRTITRDVRGVTGVTNLIDIDYDAARSDQEIEEDIVSRLQHDVRVDEGLVSVEVKDGNAVLTGTIGSAEARRTAQSLAWVNGVEDVDVSGLTVQWWARDEMIRKDAPQLGNAGVEAAVKDAFKYDPDVHSGAVSVDAKDGIVTLTGSVEHLRAKRAAETNALNTVGVLRVRNQIDVRPGIAREDAKIETAVEQAIERDPKLHRYDIYASVVNGKAYLSGSVPYEYAKWQTARIVSGIRGVTALENNLTVKDTELRADWELLADIQHELRWSPNVEASEVAVNVEDGVAKLTGTVDTWNERSAAEENAYDGGAHHVRNQLELESWQ